MYKFYRFYIVDKKGEKTIRFDNVDLRIEKSLPKDAKCLGWITDRNDTDGDVDQEYVETKKAKHLIHKGNFNHGRYRRVGYAMVYGPEGNEENAYVSICRWNELPLLSLLVGIALIIGGIWSIPKKDDLPQPEATFDTTQDNTQATITDHGKKPNVNVEGSIIYQSPAVENETWKAGSLEQEFLISNPASNTDDLAGHIYVDLNGDGELSEDECVYNPITYAEDGSVESYGKFISPGNELTDITITQKIPKGKYKAALQFTAVDIATKTLDNSMNFDFELTVE